MFCPKCGTNNSDDGAFCKKCGNPLHSSGESNQIRGRTGSGLQPNIAGLLCYVLGWITGLVFILIEKEDQFVRFHAMQSIIVFGGLTILQIIFNLIFPPLGILLSLAGLALWVLLMVKAYQGEKFKLPVVGDLAEQYSKPRH